MELVQLQALLARLIAHPEGVDAALRDNPALPIKGLIVGDERLDAVARVEIYASAYFYRLLDALKQDYPATLAMLGGIDFHNLITDYLIEYPPAAPSIFYAGAHLADFVKGHPLAHAKPYLADLATLERALIDSFHSPDAVALEPGELAAIVSEEWHAIRLRAHPSVRILDLNWRVDLVLREGGATPAAPAHETNSLLIWRRRDLQASYRVLESAEREPLSLARDGTSFATICDAIAVAVTDTDELPARINRMLHRWLADGLFLRELQAPAS